MLDGSRVKPPDRSLASARRIGKNNLNAKSPVSPEAGDFFQCRERALTVPHTIRVSNFSKIPFPPPGGGWPRRGRERNAGGKLKVSTIKQTSSRVTTKSAHWWRSSHFRNRYIAARIPLQSEKRSFGTVFLTARNCGVIAPGNHWIIDSLRGAPPPGEAILPLRGSGRFLNRPYEILSEWDS